VAGIGDFGDAYRILNGLSIDDLLDTATELQHRGQLEVLLSHASAAQGVNLPRLFGALRIVRLASAPAAETQRTEVQQAGADISQLPVDQRNQILSRLALIRHGTAPSALVLEGLMAMMAAETEAAALPAGALAGVRGPVAPGPWNPPGAQPIPFYIGNQAHTGIAAAYAAAHAADIVYTNYSSVFTIASYFHELEGTPNIANRLNHTQQEFQPDIANISRRHLYEIKPLDSLDLALSEANEYRAAFALAGVPMALGPVGEPGTAGVIPAPGGVYIFEAPQPGAITYQYRRAQLERVPVPEGQEAPEESRFRLAPLTPQQQATIATGLTGMALIIMMIILSPAGA
jgi:hypothetical protein